MFSGNKSINEKHIGACLNIHLTHALKYSLYFSHTLTHACSHTHSGRNASDILLAVTHVFSHTPFTYFFLALFHTCDTLSFFSPSPSLSLSLLLFPAHKILTFTLSFEQKHKHWPFHPHTNFLEQFNLTATLAFIWCNAKV